ncbi:MAG: hypothetical protein SGILL_009958, partial [Bacillariaceae sp.]
IGPLLSTCIDACQRGCNEIRRVQESRQKLALEVELKDEKDPRSALTEADLAAQHAIIDSLRTVWGPSLHIVGEEEEEGSDTKTLTTTSPLRKDILEDDIPGDTEELDPNDVTIFVDPLDGTREFVEGRLENCQVLVGIAIGGEAVAGAMGIPFPTGHNLTSEATIVYGLDGLGTGTMGAPLTRGPWPLEHNIDGVKYPAPHFATGDKPAKPVAAAIDALTRNFGGSNIDTYGGAGNRILAASLGEVACSLGHKVGGPWDLCAPEAIAKASGASMTDLFGDPIDMYRRDSPKRNNERGFLVSPPGSGHNRIVSVVKTCPDVKAYKESV